MWRAEYQEGHEHSQVNEEGFVAQEYTVDVERTFLLKLIDQNQHGYVLSTKKNQRKDPKTDDGDCDMKLPEEDLVLSFLVRQLQKWKAYGNQPNTGHEGDNFLGDDHGLVIEWTK